MRRLAPASALALAAVTAVLLALSGCAGTGSSPAASATRSPSPTPRVTTAADCHGVFVTVQFGLLGTPAVNACDPTTTTVTASQVLTSVGVTTAGTAKYGDEVVCRVDGEPSATKAIDVPGKPPYTEKCQGMPAAFAYWAMWVRPSSAAKWAYAQSGVTTQQLKPGQTLGLKFTTGSDTTAPQG